MFASSQLAVRLFVARANVAAAAAAPRVSIPRVVMRPGFSFRTVVSVYLLLFTRFISLADL